MVTKMVRRKRTLLASRVLLISISYVKFNEIVIIMQSRPYPGMLPELLPCQETC